MAKPRRRKVDPTERLSDQMREILLWVYKNQPERGPQGFVPWQPSVFIGETPTPSQSNALSTTLKRLEERGLLNRYSITYKDGQMVRMVWGQVVKGRIRTTHVQLTREGFLFVESLVEDGFDLEEHEAETARHKMKRQIEGLRLAQDLISKCIDRGMGDDAESDARRARLAVTESLNQLMTEYRGRYNSY